MPRKIVTPAERIDRMLKAYEKLNREAHDLLDQTVAERVGETPGISVGVMKQQEFSTRAGSTINIPAALRILREKFVV